MTNKIAQIIDLDGEYIAEELNEITGRWYIINDGSKDKRWKTMKGAISYLRKKGYILK